MVKLRFLILLPVGALMSCGAPADNPANIPLSGKWSDEGKLMSVKVGGTAVDPKEIPGIDALKAKVNQGKEFCGEPRFLTKEEFQEKMDESNPADCQIESVQGDGQLTRAKGLCTGMKLPGAEARAVFNGQAQMKPDKVIYDMSINVVVKNPLTGEGQSVNMDVRRTMTRLGDC